MDPQEKAAPDNPQAAQPQSRTVEQPAALTSVSAQPAPVKPAAPPKGVRKWVYRLLCLTVVPLLFFGLLELGLRLCGYGYPTTFFVNNAYKPGTSVANINYGRRFFPPGLARNPLPLVLANEKPLGTYRVFVLGESAAMGYPDPAVSFARILEVMLREQYPETRFEVLNTSMIGINSHVVLPIARECAGKQPDLFVALVGNNEVVGPFGAAGVIGPYSPSVGLIRTNLAVKTTRSGQLLANVARRVSGWFKGSDGGGTPHSWKGMSMFVKSQLRWNEPRLAAIHRNLQSNMRDVVDAGVAAGAQVIVCTVPVNLKDSAPFASLHNPDLSDEQLEAWKRLYQDGVAQEEAKDFTAAVKLFEDAARIDDQYADLHYRLGHCFLALKQPEEARPHFLRARDEDALRFRSDSRTNETLRTVVDDAPDGVHLVDAEWEFERKSPDRLPGEDLFLEHVHLNFSGNYLLARSVFEKVAEILPSSVRRKDKAEIPSEEQCAVRLAFAGWLEHKQTLLIQGFLTEPPFTGQLDRAEREKRWARKAEGLSKFAKREELPKAVAMFKQSLQNAPGDWMLQMHFGALLQESGELADALQQYDEVAKANPQVFAAFFQAGLLMAQMGQHDRAIQCYLAALKFDPDYDAAHYAMAQSLAAVKKTEEALAVYANRLAVTPDRSEVLEKTAQFLLQIGRPNEAAGKLNEALQYDPDNPNAHYGMAWLLDKKGDQAGALKHVDEALRIRPGWPQAVNLKERLLALQKKS